MTDREQIERDREIARLAEIEARPCPFCGATGAKLTPTPLPHDFGWQIQCNGCGARGPQSETGVGALLEWNEVAAELARLRSSPPEEQTQQQGIHDDEMRAVDYLRRICGELEHGISVDDDLWDGAQDFLARLEAEGLIKPRTPEKP